MNFLYKKAQPALVNFDNGIVRLYPAAKGAAAEQRRGHAAQHIGAEAVVDDGKTVFPQNMGNHIGGGGFSVCTGNADYFSVKAQA